MKTAFLVVMWCFTLPSGETDLCTVHLVVKDVHLQECIRRMTLIEEGAPQAEAFCSMIFPDVTETHIRHHPKGPSL